MPLRDGTGPMEQGPGTGKGMGFCRGVELADYTFRRSYHPGVRRRFASNPGGWGHRYWYHATGLPGWMRGGRCHPWSSWDAGLVPSGLPTEQELTMLKDEAAWLEEVLKNIRNRIEKFEAEAGKEEKRKGD